MTDGIEEKLRSLGVAEEDITVDVEILTASPDLETLNAEKRARGWGTASEDQYLTRLFKPLYERSPDVQARVQQELAHLGVPPEIIAMFFTEYGQALINLALGHQEIPVETRDRFVQEANQLSLVILREYLGAA